MKQWWRLLAAFCGRAFFFCFFVLTGPACQQQSVPGIETPQPSAAVATRAAEQTNVVRKRRPSTTTELRGVWVTNVDSEVLTSQSNLAAAMQKLARLNFTTVYPVVWNHGVTLFPSDVMNEMTGIPLSTRDTGLRGRNIITEMVALGHELDLDVVPWFEYGFMLPQDSELARRKPAWLTQDSSGNKVFGADGAQNVYLNPFHPEVQDFMIRLVTEVVAKYDVDGIQFDDHFSLGKKFGYDPFTSNLYKSENGGKAPPQAVDDANWVQWRCNKMTAFVATLSQKIRAIKPNFKFSVSPNPPDFARKEFLQDWPAWRDRGYISDVVVQVYRYELEGFAKDVSSPQLKSSITNTSASIGIIAGLQSKRVPMSQITQQVLKSREFKASGVSFFFYESLFSFPASGENKRKSRGGISAAFCTNLEGAITLSGGHLGKSWGSYKFKQF